VTCEYPGGSGVDIPRGHEDRSRLGLAPSIAYGQAPSESEETSRPSIDGKRDDSGIGTSIGQSTPSGTSRKERPAIAHETPRLGHHLASAGDQVLQQNINPFPDQSRPYVLGDGTQRKLQMFRRRTEKLVAVADRGHVADPEYICKTCKKQLSGKSSLRYVNEAVLEEWCRAGPRLTRFSHHVLIHDPSKTDRHLCPQCGKGFMYPKDRKRHFRTVHKATAGAARFACRDCGRTYARKDGRQRHLDHKGHTALDNEILSSPSTVSGQRSHPSPCADPRAPSSSRPRSESNIQPASQQVKMDLEASGQVHQLLRLPHQRRVSSSPTSFSATSVEDTLTTISDVDSFSL
jgi:transposase-like protein